MKTSFPLNSMPAVPVTGNAGFRAASAATNEIAATVMNAFKRYLLVMRAVPAAIVILSAWTVAARAADSETQGKTVAFVPGVMGNAFYVSMECGIRAEAAKLLGVPERPIPPKPEKSKTQDLRQESKI